MRKVTKYIRAFMVLLGLPIWICLCLVLAFYWGRSSSRRRPLGLDPRMPVVLELPMRVQVSPNYGYTVRGMHVGLTYYTLGETTTPGNTMYSGRPVYEGAIAVSRDLLSPGMISLGDILWVAATNRYYVVEDTMAAGYHQRVDIFTLDGDIAKSGSRNTEIVILHITRREHGLKQGGVHG